MEIFYTDLSKFIDDKLLRLKIGSSHSTCEETLCFLGQLLLNIFLCDLFGFLENNYFASFFSRINKITEQFSKCFDDNNSKQTFENANQSGKKYTRRNKHLKFWKHYEKL